MVFALLCACIVHGQHNANGALQTAVHKGNFTIFLLVEYPEKYAMVSGMIACGMHPWLSCLSCKPFSFDLVNIYLHSVCEQKQASKSRQWPARLNEAKNTCSMLDSSSAMT